MYQQSAMFPPLVTILGTCPKILYVLLAARVICPVPVFNDISDPVDTSVCVNTTKLLAVNPVVC